MHVCFKILTSFVPRKKFHVALQTAVTCKPKSAMLKQLDNSMNVEVSEKVYVWVVICSFYALSVKEKV